LGDRRVDSRVGHVVYSLYRCKMFDVPTSKLTHPSRPDEDLPAVVWHVDRDVPEQPKRAHHHPGHRDPPHPEAP